jgi:hypothetical protein
MSHGMKSLKKNFTVWFNEKNDPEKRLKYLIQNGLPQIALWAMVYTTRKPSIRNMLT